MFSMFSFSKFLNNNIDSSYLPFSGVSKIILLFLKEVSTVHQGLIYLIKNTVKLWNIIII